MSRSHRIWIEASGGSAKSFGVGQDDKVTMKVLVGSSSLNSKKMSLIRIEHGEDETGLIRYYELIIDGQLYRKMTYNTETKEFSEIRGFQIDGSIKNIHNE